jgi:hypothetical protein
MMTLNENIAVQNEDGIAISSDNTYRFSSFIDSDKTDSNIQSGSKKRYTMDDLFRRSENEKAYTDKEIARLMAELDEEFKKNPPQLPPSEQLLKEAEESYSKIPMFDFGLGKMSNHQAIADFYGTKIVRQIEEEIEYSYNHGDVKTGQISKKLWQKMKDIRSGKLPKENLQYENKSAPDIGKPKLHTDKKPTIKITQRQRQKGDDYFLTLERGVIRNASYRELFKGPGIVYEWLWANIVRDQWKDSKAYPIREKYYNSGYLAYCSTYGKIAGDCGMSKNTVHRYIQSFEQAGIIKTESYVPVGKKLGQTVFILGTWKTVDGERVESYYRDRAFITAKPVKK